jgi:2-polyprenyl-3-methyl-5-hydroxy-6-metoxy-1,4-benzoquinol methylase
MNLYEDKPVSYFSNIRHDLISLIPPNRMYKILEIGAGGGDTLLKLKSNGLANEVTGIELMEIPGSNQKNKEIDKFYFGDIETEDFSLEPGWYDVIICGDVLEHLVDPWTVVNKLTASLAGGGILIISCPNFRYFKSFVEVQLKGSFRYTGEGLFDKTHLRFFCKKDLKNLAESAGLKVKEMVPLFKLLRPNETYFLNWITFGLFEQLLSLQYAVVARKE